MLGAEEHLGQAPAIAEQHHTSMRSGRHVRAVPHCTRTRPCQAVHVHVRTVVRAQDGIKGHHKKKQLEKVVDAVPAGLRAHKDNTLVHLVDLSILSYILTANAFLADYMWEKDAIHVVLAAMNSIEYMLASRQSLHQAFMLPGAHVQGL